MYDANDARVYKKETSGRATTISEYYLRSSAGQELGVYDFTNGSLTWYIFGKERFAKERHQLEGGINIIDGERFGREEEVEQTGENQELTQALEQLESVDINTGEIELRLPDKLLRIQLADGTETYILESLLYTVGQSYTILSEVLIESENQQFSFINVPIGIGSA